MKGECIAHIRPNINLDSLVIYKPTSHKRDKSKIANQSIDKHQYGNDNMFAQQWSCRKRGREEEDEGTTSGFSEHRTVSLFWAYQQASKH